MSIKQRLRTLERNYNIRLSNHEWVTLELEERPSPEQQAEMDKADEEGRTYMCFVEKGDTVYTNLVKGMPKPWA